MSTAQNKLVMKNKPVTNQPSTSWPRMVADVDGTNARFTLKIVPQQIGQAEVLSCRDYDTIVDAIHEFLKRVSNPKISYVTVAITNPILDDWVQMTNHHWSSSIEIACQSLGSETLTLLNDLAAQALAIAQIKCEDLVQVGGKELVEDVPKAVIGPGTGLDISGLVPSKAGWVPLSGEGGHASFPPLDDAEVMIWQYAKKKYGHISAERFLSGSGPTLIYEALTVKEGLRPKELTPAEVSEDALSGSSPLCRLTLDTFRVMLGMIASNLALTLGVSGGVYLYGDIIPRLADYFKSSPPRDRSENKGRFDAYLVSISVYVVLSKFPGLISSMVVLNNHLQGLGRR